MGLEPWLVALSVAMAIQGGYVGLQLAAGLNSVALPARRLRLAGSATAFAVGIWSMHFVGMLAAKLPSGMDFLVLPTLISFLICVIVVGLAVFALHMGGSQWLRIGGGALAMGGGIFIMHYVGMTAVHGNAAMVHDRLYVFLAFAIAVSASGLALWLLNRPVSAMPIWLAAIVLGIAVSGMHYTAMAGTSFTICDTGISAGSPALSRDSLAIIVALIAFTVSGAFLLSLLPDQNAPAPPNAVIAHPVAGAVIKNGGDPSDRAPLSPAQGEADHGDNGADFDSTEQKEAIYKHIVVEKDGKARIVPLNDVRSVRANAHYTYISDGTQEFFCKLSIREVETNLGSRHFMRVHRSFIVALAHVEEIRRQGENGVVDIAGAMVQRSIPVARGKITVLRQRIEDETAAAKPAPGASIREKRS